MSRDAFGSVMGRIHMQKQDMSKLQTRKLHAFKPKRMENIKPLRTPDKKVKKN